MKLFDSVNNSIIIVKKIEDVEFCNPIEYYKKLHIQLDVNFGIGYLGRDVLNFNQEDVESFLKNIATEKWTELLFESLNFDSKLLLLFDSDSKKDQELILRNLTVVHLDLMSFFFRGYNEYGYKYSRYSCEHYSNGVELNKLPYFIRINNDKIEKSGETTLTDGELKTIVNQKHELNAHFIDKGDVWHCLFMTRKSLRKEEGWKEGTPHWHYISSIFGHKRDDVVENLMSRKYRFSSLPHIAFKRK